MLFDKEAILTRLSSAVLDMIKENGEHEFQRGVARGRFEERIAAKTICKVAEVKEPSDA